MSIAGWFAGRGPSGFGYNSTAEEVSAGVSLAGRQFLVTGCTSGIGLETARVLAARGATVVGAGRTEAAVAEAGRSVGAAFVPVACDLSEPGSVRACVAAVAARAPLDGIIANAGIMALPKRQVKHGHELQFLTNHVGHFLLVTGLLPRLTGDARVVVLSSEAHRTTPTEGIAFDDLSGERWYSPFRAYGQSKLANLLFARALARRLPATQTANAVHPGVIATNLGRHMSAALRVSLSAIAPLFLKTIPQGAATQTYVAVHPGAGGITGEYWSDSNVTTSSAHGRDAALAERLWSESERIVAKLT